LVIVVKFRVVARALANLFRDTEGSLARGGQSIH
jgi:hypothetical protein